MRDYTDTRVTPTKHGLHNLPGVPHLNVNRPVAVKKTSSCKWPIVGEVNTCYLLTKDSRY